MFDSVFGPLPPKSPRIPEMVGRMECRLLETLIDDGPTDGALRLTARIVEETVRSCADWIADNGDQAAGTIQHKVMRYYRGVFDRVRAQISPIQWLEEVLS
jgi:hypothetical protein